jgi:hypothetical protein
MKNDWKSLPNFYEDLASNSGGVSLIPMIEFTHQLVEEIDLADLYFLTSHALLCVSLKDYPECLDQASFSVIPITRERLQFIYSQPSEEMPDDIYLKKKTEYSVPVGKALEFFRSLAQRLREE